MKIYLTDEQRVDALHQVYSDYQQALRDRQHGALAADKLTNAVAGILERDLYEFDVRDSNRICPDCRRTIDLEGSTEISGWLTDGAAAIRVCNRCLIKRVRAREARAQHVVLTRAAADVGMGPVPPPPGMDHCPTCWSVEPNLRGGSSTAACDDGWHDRIDPATGVPVVVSPDGSVQGLHEWATGEEG